MILEVAIFAVKPESIAAFEAAYQQASPLIGRAPAISAMRCAAASRPRAATSSR